MSDENRNYLRTLSPKYTPALSNYNLNQSYEIEAFPGVPLATTSKKIWTNFEDDSVVREILYEKIIQDIYDQKLD